MAEPVKVNIDGKDIEVEPGTLIIEAARKLGIEIPTFCYDPRLKSVGACRMCLVEVEKSPKLIASCATPVAPNMIIKTNSEKVIKARKGVLEFLLINHPLDCPTCEKGGECPLQNLTLKYAATASRYKEDKIRFIDDPDQKFDDIKIGPEIWLNKNRCIICFKCVRIARDLAGGADLGMFQRGAFSKIDIPAEIKYANEFSGNTVEYCPVGALMSDSFRYKIRTWLLERTPSVSWLSPDGSNITVEHNQGKIWRHSSRQNDQIEMGFLCDTDRYGFDITSHTDRLRHPMALKLPMVNGGRPFQVISYDEAVPMAVHRFSKEKGESSALILDTTLTNEEAFCASEFFQSQLPGSAVALASELDLPDMPVSSLGLSVSMAELEKADMVIIAGCDLANEHPIVGLRVKKLIGKGVPVYIINNRRINLGRFPIHYIRAQAGKEYEVIEKIIVLKNGDDSIELKESLKSKLKADLLNSKNIHILAGYDLLARPDRDRYLNSLMKLKTALGAKLSILTTETNYLGVKLAGQINSALDDIIHNIETGKLKTLFVAGGNPVNIYPDRNRIIKAFEKLDYLIYWGAFLNDTSKLASLIFPSVLPPENSGSYVNIERRLQFMKKPYTTEKGVTSLIQLFTDIKIELKGEPYYSAGEVFARMAKVLPEFDNLKYELSEGYIFPYSELMEKIENNIPELAPAAEFPFILNFSRSAYYGASGITAMSQTLNKLTPSQKLIISPQDAGKENIEEGMKVKLITQSAEADFAVSISDDVNAGELNLFGYSDEKPPNMFMAGYNKPVYAKIKKT